MFTLNFKTIFKQVDFWLQTLHICGTILALIVIPDNTVIMGNYVMTVHIAAFGIFGTAVLQILSVILNFLIYKNERTKYRKFYEKFTTGFILVLVVTFIFANLTQVKTSYIDSGSLILGLGLLIFSPILAVYYLTITFWEFFDNLKIVKLRNSWQVPLVLLILILAILSFLLILTPQSY